MTEINLDQIRNDIDSIDEKLTDLFKQRMEKSLQVAEYKKEHHLPVFSDKREKAILHKVSEQIGEPFDGYARLIFNSIFDASRSCQNNYLAKRSDLSDRIKEALVRASQVPTLRPPVKSCSKCQASCTTIASKAYSMPSKKASASTAYCRSKTAHTAP